MIVYTLRVSHAHRKFLDIEAVIPTNGADQLTLQLPVWRPGRYERGQFARNIQRWKAFSADGKPLTARKVSHSQWSVDCAGLDAIEVHYNYHAAELNAGSTWVDEHQWYVNPVNCFIYCLDRMDEPAEIRLNVPNNWGLASGLPNDGYTRLTAKNIQTLMDGPFIAADALWHRSYEVDAHRFHIWIRGKHRFDETKLLADFKAFTEAQIRAFGYFPVDEYHFLFQLPDFKVRHGVEHENSTVIALGPAETVSTPEGYLELLAISSHELYHTWNVKSLRPAEMLPYDFTTENYSRQGYITEGVTTYMGDLFLLKAKVIDVQTYLKLFADDVMRHLHNPGRFNMSVADSSFDTWLDGYSTGIPARKVSIYTEGCLNAFMADVTLLEQGSALDAVMHEMCQKFALQNKGYTDGEYDQMVINSSNGLALPLFDNLVHGTGDYVPHLKTAFEKLDLGISLEVVIGFAGMTGAAGQLERGGLKLSLVWPDSPADKAGLAAGDLVTVVNAIQVDEHLDARLRLESPSLLNIHFIRNRAAHTCSVHPDLKYFPVVKLTAPEQPNQLFSKWIWG